MADIVFKSEEKERLEREFWFEIDRRLFAMLLGLGAYMMKKWGIPLFIVCLIRTVEENAAVGGKENSAHLPHRKAGVDLRTWGILDPEKIAAIKKYLLDTWGPDFLCVVTLDHGTGPHIHININFKYFRKEAIPDA